MSEKRSPWTWVALAGVFALIALLIYGVAIKSGGNKFDNAVAGGQRELAPTRQLRVLNEQRTASLEDYRGKVVLLNFWASWCDPCKKEAPAVERAYQRYKSQGLQVIGANVDDLSTKANAFIEKYGITYPNWVYSSGNATRDFGTRRMPETFVIDRDGKVVALQRYEVDDDWLNKTLKPLLSEGPTASTGSTESK
jgi:cytochrome c biogenesis protein CcmG/thiol:disulfide interchange protein DsbE